MIYCKWFFLFKFETMPINTDLSQLVFRKSIVAEKYIGGVHRFKEDFKFSSGKYNAEDNELISFVGMNAEDLDLDQAANNFHRVVDEEGYIIGSNDFVVVNRYGGLMWNSDWLTGDEGKGSVFFWDVDANEASIKEAEERSSCFVSDIVSRHGSWMKWGEVIF